MSVTKAERLEKEFQRIRAKHGGKLTKEIVVKEAKAKTSILHREFEWDDRKAAHRNRLDRAGELMTLYLTVRVTDAPRSFSAPMYVRDPTLPPAVGGYVSVRDVMSRANAERVIGAELDRIESCVERGRNVADALDTQHAGLSVYFETMLKTVTAARQLLGLAEAAE